MKNKAIKLISFITAAVMISMTLVLGVSAAYPKHTDFVSDRAVILDEKTEDNIIDASEKLFNEKNVRIAVCTVLDTEGENIQTYGSTLFRNWNIKDGVLILLSIDDDNFYAVQSNSLSDYLSENDLKNILSDNLEPAFASKSDYSNGVQKTVYALSNHLSNNVPDGFGASSKASLPGWAVVLIVILVIIAVIVGGGFAFIIFLRKKNARRRREEMELRRRRLAEGRGREMPRNPAQYPSRRPGQTPPTPQGAVRPQGNPAINGQRRPIPQGNHPARTQGNANQQQRRVAPSNAATIQINTSDIRAAKQNRRP